MRVVVTGISLISCLGNNLQTSWQNLLLGKTGIKLHQPFPELGTIPLGLITNKPSQLTTLTDILIDAALDDAKLNPPLSNCGIVIGSSRSYQGYWENLMTGGLRLENWLDTLPNMNAINVAKKVGTNGAVLAPMAACTTGICAISQGTMLIQTGQFFRVIVGAIEAPITPLTIAGFQKMGALAKTGSYPFDVMREGLVLGEGGAIFVLESLELATQRQAKIYGEILGFGLTADAFHSNQPEPEGKSAITAIKKCLQSSNLTTSDINYIHAHGTATILNDQVESKIIQSLFCSSLPVSSTKGSTGHTLGASGALGVAFSLMALNQQILPPSVGLNKSIFELNFVSKATQSQLDKVLCFSFGFGGQNAVIALSKIPSTISLL
ncbi:beta-ketoacyl-ACP synthase [Anabaena sp. FACHB-1237]|uniref:beta-ketoacyl-ACP synthase n=1 Tax=Anabaena sp. FACHB-1237 TaxID=2692769 RepID=UPI0016807B41|nr:beta-ketoacyl-ACP synthase [Anabaena sp. FACHB-1237]MBD2139741.1 beta-ketoacyl-ACP synthase [Anabaena sp. FACHB-1237]